MSSGNVDGSAVVVQAEHLVQSEVVGLLRQADERSAALYPAESRHGLTLDELLAAEVRFFMARQGVRAVGCGGFVRLPDGAAEIKRLFVEPGARGRGVGALLIQAIECAAAKEGVTTLLLETGINRLKRCVSTSGWAIGSVAPLRPTSRTPLSVFLRKDL